MFVCGLVLIIYIISDKWEIDVSEIKPYIEKQIGKGEFGVGTLTCRHGF